MPDIEGTVLPDLSSAREEAVRLSGALLNEFGGGFWTGETWFMEVHDEQDAVLFTLTFAAIDGSAKLKHRGAT